MKIVSTYIKQKKEDNFKERLTTLWERNFNILLFVTDRYG